MRKTKLKYLIEYEGKGNKQSSESEPEGLYPFYSCSTKIKYSNNPSFIGTKLLISTGGQFYAFLTNGEFDVSTDVLIHTIKEDIEHNFLMHFLEAKSNDINDFMFKGMGIKHLDRGLFYNIEIHLPDLATQQRIASFLDAETSKIDNLVDELTKFKANLLLQKRSLVSECVTKGVPEDRNRAYKDSGVEWLGEIPAGWELSKVKYVSTINDEALTENTNPDYTFRYIEIGGVTYGEEGFNAEEVVFKEAPSRARRIVRNGDVIVSTVRTYLKAIAGIGEDYADLIASTGFAVIRARRGAVPSFLKYYFISEQTTNKIMSISTGTSYPSVNASQVANLEISMPTFDEQQRIADYLDTETAKIDVLIGEIDNQVNLLKTYRKSLINEVVTGKVEV